MEIAGKTKEKHHSPRRGGALEPLTQFRVWRKLVVLLVEQRN
jgi:hypothetical protein